MNVKVLFFASVRDLMGASERVVELRENATVADLVTDLSGTQKRFVEMAPSLMISVNQEYVERNTVLKDGDEVAFIPPVSGG